MIESDFLNESSNLIQDLKKIPTLQPFSEKTLQGLLKLSKIRKYKSGELIIKEGKQDSWIYFLIYGEVSVTKKGKTLSVLKRRGDVFGEMGILKGSARSASIYAVGDVVCLSTDTAYIDELTGNDKMAFCYVLYRIFAEVLADRLRLTNQKLVESEGKAFKLW
jgi:CRP-like cAMP-binding protein